MTCVPKPATFRLLDATVGWDEQEVRDVVGFTDPAGLRLAHRGPVPDGPTRNQLLPWFPEPHMAPGCEPGTWFLLDGNQLLRQDDCAEDWRPVWSPHCDPHLLRDPVFVATRGHRLVVVDSGRVLVWRNEGDQLVGVIRLSRPRLAAPAPDDEVLVARGGSTDLWRFSSDGRPRGVIRTGATGKIIGLRTGPCRSIWLLTDDGGRLRIYRGHPFTESSMDELRAGLPSRTPPVSPPESGQYVATGEFVTSLIDSGVSRCRWHRVRVDADVPAGTSVAVRLVVSEDGRYAESDWQVAAPGVTDFLVDQPPGRYLTARVRLSGDSTSTPVLRRIRLDFPRTTSADLLPPAFRQDPAADDFTERFLSLFDATLAEIDRVVERYPALLDPAGVPDRVLPWLAGLLGLAFEAGWDSATRRALLAAAPMLYRRRGTPWALSEAIRIVFGVRPVLHELAEDRRWAQVRSPAGAGAAAGRPGLGAIRLFGRSSTRFLVGSSALGVAPLRAFGDPKTDPLTEHAHRFRVLLPAGSADEDALRRLVQRQAPAHTRGSVRTGEAGFVVGTRSTVGVDTAFVPPPPPVLGRVRLNHDGVLRPGRRGARSGIQIGIASAVGVHTQVS